MHATSAFSARRLALGAALAFALAGCERVGLGGGSGGAAGSGQTGSAISAADGAYAGDATRGSGTESLCERRYDVRATVRLGEIALELVDSANAARAPLRATALADANGTALASVLFQGRAHVMELRLRNGTLRGFVDAPTCRLSLSARRTDGA